MTFLGFNVRAELCKLIETEKDMIDPNTNRVIKNVRGEKKAEIMHWMLMKFRDDVTQCRSNEMTAVQNKAIGT